MRALPLVWRTLVRRLELKEAPTLLWSHIAKGMIESMRGYSGVDHLTVNSWQGLKSFTTANSQVASWTAAGHPITTLTFKYFVGDAIAACEIERLLRSNKFARLEHFDMGEVQLEEWK